MGQAKMFSIILIAGVLFVASFSIFTVDEREKVVMFQLGEIVKTDFKPGIYFKKPFVNNIQKFDARIQTLDADPERYLTSEKKNVIVDSFVKWKIVNVSNFYTATGGDSVQANVRLSQIIKDGLRGQFGTRTIQEVISGERNQIMDTITVDANEQAKTFGISIVDVRIKRIDLAREISESVYRRMEAERERVAKDLRARGEEAAEIIRAEADKKRTVILAEAYRDSEIVRGDGDGTAAKIYADTYKKDAEFYAFYRSLSAYRQTFSNQGDMLVIEPNSEYFKYFR